MASTVRTHVDGLQALGQAMAKLKSDVALKFGGRATGKGAQVIKRAAKDNIKRSPSIETGSLLDAVIVKKLGKSQTSLTAEHIVTVRRRRTGRKTKTKQSTAPHAGFVEFGTVNMSAEPFLRPAIDQHHPEATTAIVNSLKADIAKAGK